jgi:hypothetical protein
MNLEQIFEGIYRPKQYYSDPVSWNIELKREEHGVEVSATVTSKHSFAEAMRECYAKFTTAESHGLPALSAPIEHEGTDDIIPF